jgi:PKD repeat protein
MMHTSRLSRRLSLVTIVLLISVGTSVAEIPTDRETDLVCLNWLQTVVATEGDWDGTVNPAIAARDILTHQGQDVAVVYSIDPRGHVLVPLLKELAPVKSYSTTSGLDLTPNSALGYTAMLRDVLGNRFQEFVKYYGSLNSRQPDTGTVLFGRSQRSLWDEYAVDPGLFAQRLPQRGIKSAQAGPLMSTSWDQGAPYNDLCPTGDSNVRCVVGCVATAFAQVMNYWQWPASGVGSHTYWWNGDHSCGGSTPGRYLTAYFDKQYDWDNMPLECILGCSPEQGAAAAELCYDVGVAFDMGYGACGSGAWPARAETMYPRHFWYDSSITREYRFDYTYDGWFNVLKGQIDLGRPIPYTIYSHEIVCDGWKEIDDLKQIHMNYGWASGHDKWYTVDELHCPWDGCEWFEDYAMINMFPDEAVTFAPDQRIGFEPFEITFTGNSNLSAPAWSWAFGDGGTADVPNPVHVYTQPGYYNVSATVTDPDTTRSRTWQDCLIVLADSLIGSEASGAAGEDVEIVIMARNTIPVSSIRIPIVISGSLIGITLDSFSVDGCRTSDFASVGYSHWLSSTQYTMRVSNPLVHPDTDLPPGVGPVLKLYYSIPGSARGGQQAVLSFDGYPGNQPEMSGRVATYNARSKSATITAQSGGTCCVGVTGNIDGDPDELVNVSDLTRFVDYLFVSGEDLPCPAEADVDGDGNINLSDLTRLIAYLFEGDADALSPCP